jgi:DNA repair protein RecO (recombination protein O)
MHSLQTRGIVLSRINYGEADRILTALTPQAGKLQLIAKGVRKVKSKLAGGIELFSIFEASYIKGRGEISTLVSVRLVKFYPNIIKDIDRVQLGYEILKVINRNTEDQVEEEYYLLTERLFELLNDDSVDAQRIKLWYPAQLIKLAGHTPNLSTDDRGKALKADQKFNFDVDKMCFVSDASGRYDQQHIKYLRILFDNPSSRKIFKLEGTESIENELGPMLQTMFRSYLSL